MLFLSASTESKLSPKSFSFMISSLPQVARDCAFLPLALVIVGSTSLVVDKPLSADAWWQLHEKLKNKANIQLEEGKELKHLHAVLEVSYEELGKKHKTYFTMLAVLAYDAVASIEMLSNLWGKEVRKRGKKELRNRALKT